MRVLLSTPSDCRHRFGPLLGPRQIIVGPNQADRNFGDFWVSLATPRGGYDIAPMAARLSLEQRPDVIACIADPGGVNRPRNLRTTNACRILIVPPVPFSDVELEHLSRYAREEAFDRVVLTGTRRPSVAFADHSVPIIWFPGLLSHLSDGVLRVVRQPLRESYVACPPPADQPGTRLNRALRALHYAKVPLVPWPEDLEARLELLGHSLVSVIPQESQTLSGTFLEGLATGTALISNAPEADEMSGLFDESSLLYCERPEEVSERVNWALSHPCEAAARGRSLSAWYDEHLSQQARINAFTRVAADGTQPPLAPSLRGGHDKPTFVRRTAWSETGIDPLLQREAAALWQWVEAGEYRTAHDMAVRLTARKPDFIEGWVVAADVASDLQEYDLSRKYGACAERIDPFDPRLWRMARRLRYKRSLITARVTAMSWKKLAAGEWDAAREAAERILAQNAGAPEALLLRACALLLLQHPEAASSWKELLKQVPNASWAWFECAIIFSRQGDHGAARAALGRALASAPQETIYAQVEEHLARAPQAEEAQTELCVVSSPWKDLLITMPETCRRHGTGVLLKRFFPDSESWITLRSETYYHGNEEFGALNLLNKSPGLPLRELRTRLARLVEPFRVRRILCVPFATEDLRHAKAAAEIFGAPLCTYVMDDQNVVAPKTPDDLLHSVFALSRLRLTISPEMQAAYAAKYPFEFGLMPPVVTESAANQGNRWNKSVRPCTHAVLVGNVWSNDQLKLLLRFIVASGLRVDWFGREPHASLQQCGVTGRGFIAEAELASQLTQYPFVLVPSGKLDGSEDNEWLTRLSLPSRLVFLLQTGIPLLVLGSPQTAAARFVEQLGLGVTVPYDIPDLRPVLRELSEPRSRARYLRASASAAPSFIHPDAGVWIWRSLAAGKTLPAPFSSIYSPPDTLAQCA